MSIQGGLQSKKHGGAHELTHEIVSGDSLSLADQYIVIQSLVKDDSDNDDIIKNQDGGRKDTVTEDNGGISENLPFLSELRDELDSYDQAIVENNAEWLRSRCKGLQHVEFDLTAPGSVDDNLEFTGISFENKVFLSEGLNSMAPQSHYESSATCQTLEMNSAIDNLQKGENVIEIQTNGKTASVISLDGSQQSSLEPDIPMFSCSSDITFQQSEYNPELKINKSDISVTSAPLQQDSCTSGVKDSLLASTSNMDYDSGVAGQLNLLVSDINKTNMRVVVKDGVLTLVQGDDDIFSAISSEETALAGDASLISQQTSVEGAVQTPTLLEHLSVQTPSVPCSTALQDPVQVSPSASAGQDAPAESLALATISISNDKDSNSTQILVNTNQGQQLYHINMSELTALQANGGIEKSTEDAKPLLTNTADQTQAQIAKSVQGYLLLPVTNPDGSDTGMYALSNSQGKMVSNVLRDRSGKTEQAFLCTHPGCGKAFKTMAKLTVHSLAHSGERPFKCSVPNCEWSFTKLYKLKRHEESHMGKKEHVCEHCNKKFTTIYNLRTHLKQHDRPMSEVCPVGGCELKFQTRRELDRHMKMHEGVEKTYKCPYEGCNKLFLSAHCLGSHPRVHQSEPQDLTCQFEGCGRKFDKLCRLKQHQRCHTGERPYVCHAEGCTWAFSTASKLTRHMTKHTNKRKWTCNECGKGFLRAEHLKGHMITHTGIKPFTCPIEGCMQKFVAKHSVHVHMKKHELGGKDITYHCPMENCEKRYSNKAKLRQHILKHFPGTLTPADAAQLDIVPLFKNGGKDVDKKSIQPASVNVKTSSNGALSIDPIDYIANTVNEEGEEEMTTSLPNQFTAELTAELASIASSEGEKLEANTTTASSSPGQPKIVVKKADTTESNGSARTDYLSNQLLSERARKRRKLLKEKAESSSIPEDTAEEQPSDMSSSTSYSDSLSSHGITFRDPQTGVLYVQMQLLQDDPPHPDLYNETDVLGSKLATYTTHADNDPSSHSTSISEFVGSTINLQDLVGIETP